MAIAGLLALMLNNNGKKVSNNITVVQEDEHEVQQDEVVVGGNEDEMLTEEDTIEDGIDDVGDVPVSSFERQTILNDFFDVYVQPEKFGGLRNKRLSDQCLIKNFRYFCLRCGLISERYQ